MKRNAAEIAQNLVHKLWEPYLKRVNYAHKYHEMLEKKGGNLVFDHLAFRTLNTHTGEQPEGIQAIGHIIRSLGYLKAGDYQFVKKKLKAAYFEHTEQALPKIFVSQLEIEELPEWAQKKVKETVKETPYLLSDVGIELLNRLKSERELTAEAAEVLENELVYYFRRPWRPPFKETVLSLNDVSQYGAWVLLHGNSVNHFAVDINAQQVKSWPDLETTCEAVKRAGIPMKPEIEGAKGSKLQQSATLAVKEGVEVRGDDGPEKITWTYGYFEFTQRGFTKENGKKKLFSGFLGEQARHLFNMTQTRDN